MKRFAAICSVTLLYLGVLAADAEAQRRVPLYLSTPRLNPAVTLYGNQTGGTNTYLGLVRPMQEQKRFEAYQLSREAAVQRQFRQDRGALPNQLVQELDRYIQLRSPVGGVGQPATAASFMNYSHYYGQPINNGGSRGTSSFGY